MDVGMHCSVSACSQVDFLPFTCDCCRSVFCLEHRTYDAHECPLAGSKDRRVIECPLCNQMLHWTLEQDVNAVWERHVHGGQCEPKGGSSSGGTTGQAGVSKKKKKARCGADKCREILTASNQFSCTKCRQNVCLKHRFESDHDCEAVRVQQRRSQQQHWGFTRNTTANTANGNNNRKSSTTTAASSARAGATSSSTDAAQLQQNAKKVAANVVSGTKSAMNSIVQNAKAAGATVSAASANLITTDSEECPMCLKKFAYVSQLIAHVNNAHPDASSSRGSTATRPIDLTAANGSAAAARGREVCPQCRAVFSDITALIQHAESAHAAGAVAVAGGERRGSGANGQEKCSLM